jgi:hypothetical protein
MRLRDVSGGRRFARLGFLIVVLVFVFFFTPQRALVATMCRLHNELCCAYVHLTHGASKSFTVVRPHPLQGTPA